MTKKSCSQGSLLIELCIALAIIGIMGALTACVHSRIFLNTQALRNDIQLLFLARSCIEEYKAFNEVRSIKRNFKIDVTSLPTIDPEWIMVTVTVTRTGSTPTLNAQYSKNKSLKLTTRVYCASQASCLTEKKPDRAGALPQPLRRQI